MKKILFDARNLRMLLLIVVLAAAGVLLLRNTLLTLIESNGLIPVEGEATVRLTNHSISARSSTALLRFSVTGQSYDYLEWFPRFSELQLLDGQTLPVQLEAGTIHGWVYSIRLGDQAIVRADEVRAAIRHNQFINLPLVAVFFFLAIILGLRLARRSAARQKEAAFLSELAEVFRTDHKA